MTTPKSTAIQWLNPEQTVGKTHPYLFTQSQAIHARSLLPCQDTPAVKATYVAQVTCPAPLNVLMSANKRRVEENVYFFEQTQRIPAYLIAIGIGNIAGKEVGPRSTIWAEPEILDKAAWEFVETEDFIRLGESLTTPYAWEVYDLLILPPSFPYGGMENPCLTFLTPSLIAGDRSLTDVVAHEIAHSWTGNLVTNSSWEHFWLNEGFTMFIERKIIGRKYGEAYRQLDAHIGLGELRESVEFFGLQDPRTVLVPDLKNTDPDDVFSRVPYEKGHTLLYYLEQLVGGPKAFEPYIQEHVRHFAGQSIATDQWKDFLYAYFEKHVPVDVYAKLLEVDWNGWLKAPGMPPVIPEYDQSLLLPCKNLASL